MNPKKIVIILTFSFFIFTLYGQGNLLVHANKLYEKLAYAQAAEYYERYLAADTAPSKEAIHKLADCYRLLNNITKAEHYYSYAVTYDDVKPIEYYYYAKILMESGKPEIAQKYFELYKEQNPADKRASISLEAIEKLPNFFSDSSNYKIKNLSIINSEFSEFGPAFLGEDIIYLSNSYKLDNLNNRHSWTNLDFYTTLFLKKDTNGYSAPKTFFKLIRRKYNDGPASINPQNNFMMTTRNFTGLKRSQLPPDKQYKLQIIEYTKDTTGKWKEKQPFMYNNTMYNVAHPALSFDNNTLIFSSDMPDGYGGMDLYICHNQNGIWSKPVNLGDKINTKGNELFPYIHIDGTLFFSSDGFETLGGLDVYYALIKGNKAVKVFPISYPINTQWDDFGLTLDPTGKKGLIASDRPGGKGSDDIYMIDIKKPFRPTILLKGIIKNIANNLPIDSAKVVLKDGYGNIAGEAYSNTQGYYEFDLLPDVDYAIAANKIGFSDDKKELTTKNAENIQEITQDLALKERLTLKIFGLVTRKTDSTAVDSVHIEIRQTADLKVIFDGYTDANGTVLTSMEDVERGSLISLTVTLNKPGFLSKRAFLDKTIEGNSQLNLHEFIDLTIDPVDVGVDIGKLIDIKPIYFDLGKWDIRPDAAVELDKIVSIMNENPGMVIELGSHTDCRGSAKANYELSDRRAKASANYIISKGINKTRIYGKGYGESKLLNDCGCEGNVKSDCSEDEHKINRRTEFIIVKMQ